MSLSLRNIDKENKVHERFIGFINCHDYEYQKFNDIEDNVEPCINMNLEPKLTGEILGNTVVNFLKDMSLNLDDCIGIATDGCAVMTSVIRGAVQHIQKSCVNAVYSPCSNHALNLSISKSSNVQLVRNTMGIIKEVLSFFNSSSKRSFILKNNLKGQKRSITSLCETRWIERHDSIFEFQTNLREIVDSLVNISEWDDQVSSSKAKTLIFSVCNCEFIMTLFTVSSILSVTTAASKLFQSVTQDVASATNCINDILKILNEKRSNCDVEFSSIFEESKNLMIELDVEMKRPRIAKRQNQRCNTQANSIEEYYRRILFIPVIDNVLKDIKDRFLNDKMKTIFLLMQLIPSNTIKMSLKTSDELIRAIGCQYAFLNFNMIMFRGELELWKTKWTTQKDQGNLTLIILCN